MTLGGHPQVKINDETRTYTVEAALMEPILQREQGRSKNGG
jgi:hypothetical protein